MIAIDIIKRRSGQESDFELTVQMEIKYKAFVCIYGPSGSGKTSLLRLIAGLDNPDAGSIKFTGDFKDKNQSDIAFLFQDYALFPNMSVIENIEFAQGRNKDKAFSNFLLEKLSIRNLKDRKVTQLSGGQKQRVAFARAIAQKPKLLLLDEPLSALDYKSRIQIQNMLLELHQELNLTTIMVSHDISEIVKLSQMVIVLENGKITQKGSPEDIFLKGGVSGKFKFTGEILNIIPSDSVSIVTVLIQNQIVRVVAEQTELKNLEIGDKVVVASKAFNPVIYKI